MYRIIMENYEDAQNVLLKENHDIRKYLKHMQDQINDALKEKKRGKFNYLCLQLI